jgi:hypothetical protein
MIATAAAIWDAATGRQVHALAGPYHDGAPVFSRSGSRLATASFAGAALV